MIEVPEHLRPERDALIAEIHEAFKGVSREGGVSWNESEIIDMYGSDEECARARATDADKSWMDLSEDAAWRVFPGVGGFSFLDPVGFRYYLPAAMIQNLCSDGRDDIDYVLTLNKATKPGGFRLRDHTLEKWSLLDKRQRKCVARFIRFMIVLRESPAASDVDHYEARDWRVAFERYWQQFGP